MKSIFLMLTLLSCQCLTGCALRTVGAGSVGIGTTFGSINTHPYDSGIHFVFPLMNMHRLSIRTIQLYEKQEVPSKEGLNIHLEASALFHLDAAKAVDVFTKFGPTYADTILRPAFRSELRGVTAKYEAKTLYTSGRDTIASEVFTLLSKYFSERGFVLENVLLRKITLPESVQASINAKLSAEQDSEKMKFILQKETQEAERKTIEAKGISDFQKIVTQGISEPLLKWKGIEATEKLAQSGNSKIIVIGQGNSGLPIILGGDK